MVEKCVYDRKGCCCQCGGEGTLKARYLSKASKVSMASWDDDFERWLPRAVFILKRERDACIIHSYTSSVLESAVSNLIVRNRTKLWPLKRVGSKQEQQMPGSLVSSLESMFLRIGCSFFFFGSVVVRFIGVWANRIASRCLVFHAWPGGSASSHCGRRELGAVDLTVPTSFLNPQQIRSGSSAGPNLFPQEQQIDIMEASKKWPLAQRKEAMHVNSRS